MRGPQRIQPPVEVVADAHRVSVSALAFSRDGRWLASGARDGSVLAHQIG